VAVELALSDDPVTAAQQRAAALQALGGELTPGGTDEERDAFRHAGWVFVLQPPGGVPSMPGGVRAVHTGPVFHDLQGRVLVGSGRLTVRRKPHLSPRQARAILQQRGLEIVRELRFANAYQVRVPGGTDFLDVAAELHGRDDFEYAEPEMIEHIGRRWRPKDPDYPQQWQWHNDGSGGGKAGADVGAESAWTSTRGQKTRIAVIDFAFDLEHEDLKQGVGAGTGYFRKLPAGDAEFVSADANYPVDADGHGTFCAGMAAARAGNKKGGCGIANRAELMLVACLDDALGTQETLARAVGYAADPGMENSSATAQDGAWVISCSVGPPNGVWILKSLLRNAIDFAVNTGRGGLGVPVFWAVANLNVALQTDEVCSNPPVIAVGRSNSFDSADGSAFGPGLALLAPGTWVYSTLSAASGRLYGWATGTSFAAPCAAGIAALVLDLDHSLTSQDVRKIIQDSSIKVGPKGTYDANGHSDEYGYGRISAAEAVNAVNRMLAGIGIP
jgi:hypothetical protein